MFDESWEQTEYCLLEAEKFVRLKGLHRHKSRKRRLLHHCYAFMRIMHESIFLLGKESRQRLQVRMAVESSGLIIAGQDKTCFRLSGWDNLVQKMLEVKSRDQVENDLHLETPGFFSATMYPEIYGVPEEWVVLLSQVIRLGNEKDLIKDGSSTLSVNDFWNRAKALEGCVVQGQRLTTAGFAQSQTPGIDGQVLEPLLDALHNALIIYFYRRIHDIDASMLQEKVKQTRDSLLRCDRPDLAGIRYAVVFIWPAFIAACEAEDESLRGSFSSWFADCALRGGQSFFTYLHQIVEQVWRERSASKGSNVTWLDFMKRPTVFRPRRP